MEPYGNGNRRRKRVKNDEEEINITYRYNSNKDDDNNRKSRFSLRRGGGEGRRTPKGYDWFLFFGFVAAVRMLWSSIAFSKNLDGGGHPYYKMNIPHREMMSKGRPSRRKRPPRHILHEALSSLEEEEDILATTTIETTTEPQPTFLKVNVPKDLSILCGTKSTVDGTTDTIHSESRIFISGILTHPLGSELALFLANTCGTRRIVGYTDHPLDSDGYSRLSFLLRQLPEIEIIYTDSSDSSHASQDVPSIFSSLDPTHVIHLEPISFLSKDLRIHPPYIAVRNSINKLERLCEAIVKQKLLGMENSKLIYVVASSKTGDKYISRGVNELFPMVLKMYRSLYSIDIVQLKLPTIYGPFPEAEFLMDKFLGRNTTSLKRFSASDTMIHITNSLYVLLECIQRDISDMSSSIVVPTFVASNSLTNTFEYLSTLVTDHSIKTLSKASKEKRSLMLEQINILSWYNSMFRPYGQPTGEKKQLFQKAIDITNSHLAKNESIGISQLQRRQYNLLPCSSECGSFGSCTKTSAFDSNILQITQNVTSGCKYILYTSDFSKHLADLPAMKETMDQGAWPIQQLCQVAFVSSQSRLVSKLVTTTTTTTTDENEQGHRNIWNGKLQHNRWQLVWPNDDEDTTPLQEADYIMPKVVPGNFFSKNVTKALYLEPNHLYKLPSLPVLWYLMAKQMEQRGRKDRGIPAKHMSLFSHTFGFSESDIKSSSALAMAKFVLRQKGRGWEGSLPNVQTRFYSHALNGPRPLDFEIPDTFLVVHNLQSERSRRLRCEWYEEHLVWSDGTNNEFRNRDLEDLSLSFVLAQWKMEQRLVYDDDTWGDRLFTREDMLENPRARKKALSQYFVKLHKPMKVRRHYDTS